MKVLLFAHACSPKFGSEGGIGWKSAMALARRHEVHVITNAGWKAQINEARDSGVVPDTLSFHYIGRPPKWHPNRMIARLQSWNYYRRDMREVLPLAGRLHEREHFDLSHHVTYASWRIGSPLWRLPIPFVFGPVGGAATMPPSVLPTLDPMTRLFERVRDAHTWLESRSISVLNCLQRSTVLVASNGETREFLQQLRQSPKGLAVLSSTFFNRQHIKKFSGAAAFRNLEEHPFRLFAGGSLEGRKGVAIALQALSIARKQSLAFRYTIGGGGPELLNLKRLANALGISDCVFFHNGFSGDNYAQELGRSHVFFMPSFRETAPVTIMESMLAGCVPMIADWGAQGEIVTPECGIRVPVSNPGQMAEEFAGHLLELNGNRARLASLGEAARQRIENGCSEEHFLEGIGAIYEMAIRRHNT